MIIDPRRFVANAEQAAYWDGASGQRWATHQEALDRHFAPLIPPLLERAGIAPGMTVLDVGPGTGASLLALAERLGGKGRLMAVDVSAPLLTLAERRLTEAGHHGVELYCADAASHAFAPASLDRLVSRFGVMFFADPVTAFANLRRALKPDGRLAFVAWTGADDNPWFAVPGAIATRHLGPPEPAPPRAPGPLAFAEADYVREVLTDAGFQAVEIAPLEVMLIGAADAVAETAIARHVGPIARRLREVEPPPAVVDALMAEAAQAFRAFETPAGIRIPARVHLVHARPG